MTGTPRALAVLAASSGLVVATAALAAVGTDSSALRAAVTLKSVRAHQEALQGIADANGGTRASGTPGYDASADYVVEQLDPTFFDVTVQPFTFAFFEELSPPDLEQTAPNAVTYVEGTDFLTMEYSGSGDATATLQAVDLAIDPAAPANTSTSGCEASDFSGYPSGAIALVQRGSCTFGTKAANAQAAGAAGVIIFNEGQAGRTELFGGTLGGPDASIPVVSATFALGETLAGLLAQGPVTMRIRTDTVSEDRDTSNVIAETKAGRSDRVVVVGAHLDSVPEGPGINDNGSGTAGILEVARQMALHGVQPRNKVRFAWWGAEESGLIGSERYVSGLSARDIKNIAVNLNFDMIGSPNFVRFVYDGDGSATGAAGPNGSSVVEDIFVDYFRSQGLPTAPTAFDGRSDYGPFIDVGIPAGGLFTGAEEIKTTNQAEIFGGTAGVALDPCYHLACDTFANNSDTALDEMSDAVAHAVLQFAMTTSAVKGTSKANDRAVKRIAADTLAYRGSHLQR